MPTDLVTNFAVTRSVEAFFTGGPVQWSSDGLTLFTPCGAVVKSMNVDTGTPGFASVYLLTLFFADFSFTLGSSDDNSSVSCVRLAPSDRTIVIAYSNGLLRLYAMPKQDTDDDADKTPQSATMERQWKSTHFAPIMVMEFGDDGNLLATGSADFCIKVF